MRRTGLLTAAAFVAIGVSAWRVASAGQGAFDTREAFDAMDAIYADRFTKEPPAAHVYAWGASYVMKAYVAMYRATGDTAYLDKLVRHADVALAGRDRDVGAKDYLGRALPAWSAGGPYSIGEIELCDAAGQPTLYLRSALTGSNNQTRVEVAASTQPGRFDLRIENERYKRRDAFAGLSMDPASDRYAPARIMASKLADPTGAMRLVAKPLGRPGRNPSPVRVHMKAPRYVWPVHQGMILEPITEFARLVRERPKLAANAAYAAKADVYIRAAEEVLGVIDSEWRENAEGEGWFQVAKGAPVWMDGVEEPHNHALAVGSAILHLAAATGNAAWRVKVEKLARMFKNDLRLLPENGAYVWPYWWSKGHAYKGWTPEQNVSRHTPGLAARPAAEDFSHGSIDVGFAVQCFRDGIVFDREDMRRFAGTLLRHVVTRTEAGAVTFRTRVDGSGEVGKVDRVGPAWVLLAEAEPQVLAVFREIRRNTKWSGYGVLMLQSANMNWLEARSARRDLGEISARRECDVRAANPSLTFRTVVTESRQGAVFSDPVAISCRQRSQLQGQGKLADARL